MPTLHLTDLGVRGLKGSAKYISYMDDTTRGFGIRVGLRSKTWIVVRGRKRERITIGKYPDVSLSEARTEAKRLLSTTPGAKPVSITFAAARDQFVVENYRNSKSRWPHLVKLMLSKHFKAIEARQLTDVTDEDISNALKKLGNRPSQQLHVYRAARTFLKWCTRPPRRYLKNSPMEGYEAPARDRKGTRTLTDAELKAVWTAAETGSRSVFRLLILWGTRNTETTSLERAWAKDEVLTIPGAVTKNGREHAIPLLPLARAVLDERPAGRFYFAGRYSDDEPLAAGSLNRMKREIQDETGTREWQIRDIRRTFRSNMARLGVPREICEVLINHAPPVLDEIYDRYDRLEEKRDALAKYEAFLLKLVGRG